LYFAIHRTPLPAGIRCACGIGADRFACLLACILLSAGLFLFYIGQQKIAWAMVLFVGGLSIMAGTIGFCLGAVIYALAFERKNS
jgi:hypothetical protein